MAEMTIEQAWKIVHQCMDHVLIPGIRSGTLVSLEEYSLNELLEANQMVAKWPFEPQPGGDAFRQSVASDKLVAALYVATHYEPMERPIVTVGNKALMVVDKENVGR